VQINLSTWKIFMLVMSTYGVAFLMFALPYWCAHYHISIARMCNAWRRHSNRTVLSTAEAYFSIDQAASAAQDDWQTRWLPPGRGHEDNVFFRRILLFG
jgi:hypothetical protein